MKISGFRAINNVDFEYSTPPGERPRPICCTVREMVSGRTTRLWLDGASSVKPPMDLGPDALYVAFYSIAEFSCHLVLGWPLPVRILDLYVEFRAKLNGLKPPAGWSILGALACHGLSCMSAEEKAHMRQLAIRGGPFTS